jgi:GTP cyclohydrolase I
MPAESSGLVVLADIPFVSLCEHHLLPFFGKASVAFLPAQNVVGLGKLVSTVEVLAQRLQFQERLTESIADVIQRVLEPQGTFVMLKAQHVCMLSDGASSLPGKTVTQATRGIFTLEAALRAEVVQQINEA